MLTNKLRNNNGLSNEEIMKIAPSVFASQEHEDCSSKYVFIPTINIMEGLRKEGFIPVEVIQGGTRKQGHEDFTKHMLRFRNIKDLGSYKLNTEVTEIGLVNSHDRTSSLNVFEGTFRTICENGLTTGKIDNEYRVMHKGNIIDDVIESTCKIIEDATITKDIIRTMKSINLNREEQLFLSEFSMKAKYNIDDEEEGNNKKDKKDIIWTPDLFLKPRRQADTNNDLFTTYNVIQENLVKGGQRIYNNRYERRSTRPINSIDGNIKVNKLLWQFANKMLELKTR